MRRQENCSILRVTFWHWNKELKAGEPEKLVPSHLILDVKLQEQEDKQELPDSAFLFEMLRGCKYPWMGGK
jgi:hypothetical protein